MQWCVRVGDHGLCECSIVNSPSGRPGPAGERGDAGMTGEFGREGDVGNPGPHGDFGSPVRIIKSFLFFLFHCSSPFCLLTIVCLALQGFPGLNGEPGPQGRKGEARVVSGKGAVYLVLYLISEHLGQEITH